MNAERAIGLLLVAYGAIHLICWALLDRRREHNHRIVRAHLYDIEDN